MIFPTSGGAGGGDKQARPTPITVKVKNVAKAIIGKEQAKRRKAAGAGNKKLIARARRKYNTLKRKTIAAIKKGKAAHYKLESKKIKSLPAEKQKSARSSLRVELKKRLNTLVAKLPKTSKMNLRDLERVTKLASRLRW